MRSHLPPSRAVAALVLAALAGLATIARPAVADRDPRLPMMAVRCGDGGSGRALVVLPAADGVLAEAAIEPLEDAADAAKLPTGKVKRQVTHAPLTTGWCAAEKTVKVGARTVNVIVSGVGEMTGLAGDTFEDKVTVVARTFTNKEAAALARTGKLVRPAAVAGVEDDAPIRQLRAALADRAATQALWATTDDVILAGSAPGELYVGARARKTFAAWKLGLRIDGDVQWSTVGGGELVWALANVAATPAKGGPSTTYRVLFVLLADHATTMEDGELPADETWHLVLAHFALVE